jgi:regulation of enolase protein 1 (concanavalin A-like superfamily)
MQDPTDQAETSIPAETVREGPNLNRIFTVRRKAAKRILPWDLPVDEIQLALPRPQDIQLALPRPQEEVSREIKRPRLEFHGTTAALPLLVADNNNNDDDANVYSVTDTQPNVGPARWTPEEDAKLTSAATNTPKKRRGKEYKTDWVAIALLVPGRTERQCYGRWDDVLYPKIDRATARAGKWTADEDSKLKVGIQRHGDKDWVAIAALVPGRTRSQCLKRWREALDPSIDLANNRTGKWTVDECSQLKSAVQTHGGKDWAAIALLVPGRTQKQCCSRWRDTLHLNSDQTYGRTGKWTADEDSKLKNALRTHGGKDWATIALLVPGRTQKQCHTRWRDALDLKIDQTNERTGIWTVVEDMRLKVAVQTYGDKDWGAISELVPSRTQMQCWGRWQALTNPTTDLPYGHNGPWLPDRR